MNCKGTTPRKAPGRRREAISAALCTGDGVADTAGTGAEHSVWFYLGTGFR